MWSGNAGSFIPSLASLYNSTLNTAGLSPPSVPICNRSIGPIKLCVNVTTAGIRQGKIVDAGQRSPNHDVAERLMVSNANNPDAYKGKKASGRTEQDA
jgi:hypothetical protein